MVSVDNLYYLLCYAWDHADLAAASQVGAIPGERVEHLLAHVLTVRASELLRRGLHREYVTHNDVLRTPRGKIDVSSTIKRNLECVGRAECSVDDLSNDVPLNQILKATLARLATTVADRELKLRVLNVLRRLPPLSAVDVSADDCARARLHRHNAHYRFALHVCELVLRHLVPHPTGGRYRFVDFRGDERAMGLLFEAFVRNLLRREQDHFRIGRENVVWALDPIGSKSGALLPAMQTDITLTAPGRRVVLETKYYSEPLRVGRDGRRRLREDHLYQLFAYVQNLGAAGRHVDVGVLLYASAGERFDHRYRLGDREIRACAIDLHQPWEGIRGDLLRLAGDLGATSAAA